MKTLGDMVLEDAVKLKKKGGSATSDGIEFLELRDVPENYAAGNRYLAALNIINEFRDQLKDLGKTLDKIKEWQEVNYED